MKQQTRERDIKLIPIGNSKGVRIPKVLLEKYNFAENLLLVETEAGLLLRKNEDAKLSWEDTYKDMSKGTETWHEFDLIISDGLESEDFDY